MAQGTKSISQYFLFLALGVSLYFAFLIFRPFFAEILMAGIFASILYPLYKWFLTAVRGRESLAALITLVIFVLLIVIPIGNFMVLLARESADTYASMQERVLNGEFNTAVNDLLKNFRGLQEKYLPFVNASDFDIKTLVLDLGGKFNSFVLSAASSLIRGTTQLITSLFFVLISMFFLLRDGHKLAEKVAYLTPLSNKYDKKVFDKFREVSRATILSSLLIGIVQGVLSGIAYYIIGFPAFFLGVATGVASLIPVVGTGLVMVPVLLVLFFMGKWWAFIFMAIWFVPVGLADNVIRTLVIKGQSQIHPLLVFFSIFGGVEAFGVQGIIFGPLILAIVLTMLHIYELEYEHVLER